MDSLFRFVTLGLTIFIIGLIIIGLIKIGFKKKKITNSDLIKQPEMYFWGGIFVSLIFGVLTVALPFLPTSGGKEIEIAFSIFSILMIVVGIIFIWYYAIWEIELKSKSFTYRDFWGKSRDFLYNECTSVTRSARIDIYHKDKVIVRISALSENWYELSKN